MYKTTERKPVATYLVTKDRKPWRVHFEPKEDSEVIVSIYAYSIWVHTIKGGWGRTGSGWVDLTEANDIQIFYSDNFDEMSGK